MTPREPVDLEALLDLHTQTSPGPWEVYPNVHQDTKIVQQGRGMFGLIADVSAAPAELTRLPAPPSDIGQGRATPKCGLP